MLGSRFQFAGIVYKQLRLSLDLLNNDSPIIFGTPQIKMSWHGCAIGGNELGNSLGVMKACNIHAAIFVLWSRASGAHWKMGRVNGAKMYCVGWYLATPKRDLFDILFPSTQLEFVWNIYEKRVLGILYFTRLPVAPCRSHAGGRVAAMAENAIDNVARGATWHRKAGVN